VTFIKGVTIEGQNRSGRPPATGTPRVQKRIQRALLEFARFMTEPYSSPYSFVPDKDGRPPTAYELLMAFAVDGKYPAAIRVAAATAATKCEPKYLHHPIDLPHFTSIQEAETYKLGIAQREARNELDAASSVAFTHASTTGSQINVPMPQPREPTSN
jgi:hypothetical protein